jgi:hypothetical protein
MAGDAEQCAARKAGATPHVDRSVDSSRPAHFSVGIFNVAPMNVRP